jgi:uncharacterized protein YggE
MRFFALRAAFPVAFLLACAGAPAAADPASQPRLLSVSGTGEARGVPDRAMLSTGVVTQGRTAAAALAANARAMTAVFDTLKRAGIAGKDIQTSSFSVSPQYAADKPGASGPQHVVGYEVTNTVSVTVDGMDKLGPTIDALVAAGSNQIDGPDFTIADPKPLLAKAREDAVKDAMARAETLAHAAGVTLGPIVSISEGSASAPEPMRPRGMLAMAKSAPTPVAAGEESLSVEVSVTWEIH